MTTTEAADLEVRLQDAKNSLQIAAHLAEQVANWKVRGEQVKPDVVLGELEELTLFVVRLVAAARKAHLRFTDDVRQLAAADRVVYELLTTAGSAARQFHHSLAEIADEHQTLPDFA